MANRRDLAITIRETKKNDADESLNVVAAAMPRMTVTIKPNIHSAYYFKYKWELARDYHFICYARMLFSFECNKKPQILY